ncbi:GIY-YIG nuclease family protein [Candidatus Bipolaricaulota bacterium]|nr:GIY-YIG nuclease family protein [Candidatus Bipolaricaulota bacterium]
MSQYPEGIYALIIKIEKTQELEIGNLAREEFRGKYLYVGSAHGPGGLQRVTRHMKVSTGSSGSDHWHVDYLTGPGEIRETWLIPTERDLECELVSDLAELFDQPVEGFGSSDCDCFSHLFSYNPESKERLIKKLDRLAPEGKPIRFEWG